MVAKKIVHQVMITDSGETYEPPNHKNIQENFPEYATILWASKDIKKLMIKNGDTRVSAAFDKIRAFAFKADIARYYILYNYGGWYTDVNNFFARPAPNTEEIDMVVFRDESLGEIGTWSVQNSLFFSTARNSILSAAIDRSVMNVESDYYGPHPLCVTSPVLFGAVMADGYALMHKKTLIGDFHMYKYDPRGFYFGGELFCLYKPNVSSKDVPVVGGNKYAEMWYNRELYN